MTADDLPAAFAALPAAWRAALPGWTPAAERAVIDRVRAASGTLDIAPADPFRALRLVPPEAARVVVFGQDPYPKPGHADGLAFSAGHGRPHSLRRIFQVLASDRPGWAPPAIWKLDAWAEQGVLLLNPTLTVEVAVPAPTWTADGKRSLLKLFSICAAAINRLRFCSGANRRTRSLTPPVRRRQACRSSARATRHTTSGASSWPTAATSWPRPTGSTGGA